MNEFKIDSKGKCFTSNHLHIKVLHFAKKKIFLFNELQYPVQYIQIKFQSIEYCKSFTYSTRKTSFLPIQEPFLPFQKVIFQSCQEFKSHAVFLSLVLERT